MNVDVLTTPGLGDTSYVLTIDGVSIFIDPQRDIERFTRALDDHDGQARFVFETHIHNDYLSGGFHLADGVGAELVMPAGCGAGYRFRPAFHTEALDAGPFAVRPLHTPGHTPEHTSYVVEVEGEPVAVFSGGSLLVGAAGRTDLLGQDRARSLVRLQHGSLQRLARLGDHVELYPTHGAGSFCSSSLDGGVTSTIGKERKTNPLLAIHDVDDFATAQLTGLPPYPDYYAHMGPINLRGAPAVTAPSVPTVGPADLVAAMDDGVHVVDARYKVTYGEGHVPGSWGIEEGSDFATWVGWLLPFDAPIILVVDDTDTIAECVTALSRIGFDHVVGAMVGMDDWIEEGRPVASHATMGARDFLDTAPEDAQVLDVRAPTEWVDGVLDGATLLHLPEVIEGSPDLDPDRPVYIGCTTGHRASIAAGVLAERGFEPIVLTGASLLGVIMLREAAATA